MGSLSQGRGHLAQISLTPKGVAVFPARCDHCYQMGAGDHLQGDVCKKPGKGRASGDRVANCRPRPSFPGHAAQGS
jgi:hypothetical protein